MFVIAKRTILFRHEAEHKSGKGEGGKAPRQCLIHGSKDVQEVPDWLAEQDAFVSAQQNDKERGITADIMVVIPQKVVAPPPAPIDKKPEKTAEPEKEKPAESVDLSKLTKAELVAHAEKAYGLELADELKKDEMIAAITEKAKAAAS